MYNILIVDDEKEEREGVAFLLEEFHYPVQAAFASNGREALDCIRRHPIDILFTDVRMPIVDGLILAEKAKELFPSIKIIIFSGYSDFEYARTAMHIGVSHYILKPVNVNEFCETIEQVIQSLTENRQQQEKLSKQESYAHKHLLLQTLYREATECFTASAVHLSDKYQRLMLFEFDKGFFDSQYRDPEREILKHMPENTEYLNLNDCQSILLFKRSADELWQSDTCLELARSVHQSIVESYGVPCYIAFSEDISSSERIYTVFHHLEELLEYRFFLPDTYFYYHGMRFEALLKKDLDDDELVDSIQEDIHTRNFAGLKLHLDFFCLKFEQNPAFSQIYVKFIFSNIYLAMVKALNSSNPSQHQMNKTIDTLYQSRDIREITSLVREIAGKLENAWKNAEIGSSLEVDKVKAYIEDHYMDNLDLISLADTVYLSPVYLSALFKKIEGCGINRYIKTVRMEKARNLLENTNIKIVDLCRAIGYNNVSYFCQNFREYYGETPERYRKTDYYYAKKAIPKTDSCE